MLSADFLLTALIVVLLPGTGVIYTISTGLFQGARASLAAALGCTAGIVPHLLASVLGLATVLHMSALLFQLFKLAGAAYLVYMAWSIWRESDGLNFNEAGIPASYRAIAPRGFLINILNPKLSIFFLAFLPQFVVSESSVPLLQMLTLSAAFMVMTFIIFTLYGLSASKTRTIVVNSPRMIRTLQKSFAAVFAALGIKLAMAES